VPRPVLDFPCDHDPLGTAFVERVRAEVKKQIDAIGYEVLGLHCGVRGAYLVQFARGDAVTPHFTRLQYIARKLRMDVHLPAFKEPLPKRRRT